MSSDHSHEPQAVLGEPRPPAQPGRSTIEGTTPDDAHQLDNPAETGAQSQHDFLADRLNT